MSKFKSLKDIYGILDYDIDALVCGKIDDYVWITKYEIYDLILTKRCLEF